MPFSEENIERNSPIPPLPQFNLNMNSNNQNNIRNKYNPAKHRMPSPAIKSNFSKRPPLPNSGSRINTNKSDKFN